MTTENADRPGDGAKKDKLGQGRLFAARAALTMIALKDNLAG